MRENSTVAETISFSVKFSLKFTFCVSEAWIDRLFLFPRTFSCQSQIWLCKVCLSEPKLWKSVNEESSLSLGPKLCKFIQCLETTLIKICKIIFLFCFTHINRPPARSYDHVLGALISPKYSTYSCYCLNGTERDAFPIDATLRNSS